MAKDWKNLYNTELTPEEEVRFQAWAKKNNRLNDDEDYDIRGAWKELSSGTMTQADNGHLGDKYKKPNHPTFSTESKYNNVDGYVGGSWSTSATGETSFTPGKSNIYSTSELKAYFDKVEPGVKLITPGYSNEIY